MTTLDIGEELRAKRLSEAQLRLLWQEYELRCWLRAVVAGGLRLESLDPMQRDLVRLTLDER